MPALPSTPSTDQPQYLYLPGRPRDYRFNGQNGQFNIGGDRILFDSQHKPISSFTFQPITYRIFEDQLFGRENRETWAELFFIDAQDCVSVISFNNTSVAELYKMMEPLFYERRSLSDIVITARPEIVTSKKDSTKKWALCRFSYELADEAKTKAYKAFAATTDIFRADSITDARMDKLLADNFRYPGMPADEPLVLGEASEQADLGF